MPWPIEQTFTFTWQNCYFQISWKITYQVALKFIFTWYDFLDLLQLWSYGIGYARASQLSKIDLDVHIWNSSKIFQMTFSIFKYILPYFYFLPLLHSPLAVIFINMEQTKTISHPFAFCFEEFWLSHISKLKTRKNARFNYSKLISWMVRDLSD